jgi:O-antigen/teichoic acid export membrane protein
VILFRINPFRNLSFSRSIIRKNRYVIKKVLFPIFITSFIEAPILWIAQVLLVRWNNIESVGSVTAILQIRSLVILIPSYIFSTFLSFASKLNAQGEYSLYFKRFDTLAKVLLFASVSLSILLTLFSQQVLGLYGTEYRVDYLAMIISNVEIPLLLYSGLLKLDLIVQERQKQLMYISLIWNVIWLVLLYIFLRIEVDSVIAFFASQLIALTIYSVYIFILYTKDKKTLLSRLNETK